MKENHSVNIRRYYDLKFHINPLQVFKIHVFDFIWTKFEFGAKLIGQYSATAGSPCYFCLIPGVFWIWPPLSAFLNILFISVIFSFSHFGQVLGDNI
jgi:hypothetical protein